MEIFKIVTLAISGLLLFVLAGVLRLSNPIKNYLKNSGIKLDKDVNMLSEARGMSSVMLLGGLVVLSGTFVPEMAFTSLVIAIMLFLGFAMGRLISYGVDGKPNNQIIIGLTTEIVLGSLNALILLMVIL